MSKNIIEVADNLERLRPTEPATPEQIAEAEKKLGLKFADDYKELLSKYNFLYAKNIEIYGISDEKTEDTVKVTLYMRENDYAAPKNMYVIENVGVDGWLTWQAEDGTVYYKAPWEEPQKTADSLAEHIERVVLECMDDDDDDF